MFCRYRCWYYVLSIACDYSSCFGDAYFVGFVMVIVIALILYGSMGPWCPVFSLNCYRRPYGERNKIFVFCCYPYLPIHSSSLSPSFLHNFLNCSHLIVSLNLGLNLHVSLLNSPNVSHVTFSVYVSVSKNWRPFLPNQFFTIASCSACRML